jgi:cyclopropane fatty-acyl-phospholipid synthase-like methyltransferase
MNRHEWIVDLLQIEGSERVLEVGCGNGAAVSHVCARLNEGNYTAIDRSEKKVQQAINKNKDLIKRGKAHIIQTDLFDFGKSSGRYDKIYSINVNCFWMSAERELDALRTLLVEDGSVFLANVPPVADKIPYIAQRTEANLNHAGFRVVEVKNGLANNIPGVCVIAKRQ